MMSLRLARFLTRGHAALLCSASKSRFASTLIVSDPLVDDTVTPPGTQAAVTAAQQLHDGPISLLVVSDKPPTQVPVGVSKVLHASCGHHLSETVASAIQTAQSNFNYDYIVAPSSKFGSSVIPRAAALLNVSPVTDVLKIVEPDIFVRPMYAGNVLVKVKAKDDLKILSIRPTSFEKADLEAPVQVETLDITPFDKAEWVGESVSTNSDRPDLSSASIVISGGRGLKSGDNFALLEALADKLGAAVGASRAAVDAGYVPNDWQVGQTGKVVAPNLYIAVGISGAIQHLSGMKDSKVIVAINKDREAPIFQVADYGLVADLFTAVPELTSKV